MLKPLRIVALALVLFAGPVSLSGCCLTEFMQDPSMDQERASDASSTDPSAQVASSTESSDLEREPHPFGTVLYGFVGLVAAFLVIAIITGGL